MDAIESGIVKIPRIPVDDDAAGKELVYLQPVGPHPAAAAQAPRQRPRHSGPQGWVMPETLEGALRSLYRSYEHNHARYEADSRGSSASRRRCSSSCVPNTVVSKLVFDWIAGREVELEDGTRRLANGKLDLCSATSRTATWIARQRTILVDSAQLESGEPLGGGLQEGRRA